MKPVRSGRTRQRILPLPDATELKLIFIYEPTTGRLFRHMKSGKLKELHPRGQGPFRVNVKSKLICTAAKLIYKMMTNEDSEYIGHRDGNPHNNKWDNLMRISAPSRGRPRNIISDYQESEYKLRHKPSNAISRGTKLALKSGETISVIYAKYNEDNKIFEVIGRLANGCVVTADA